MTSILRAHRKHTCHSGWLRLRRNLNFFRLHVLFFIFIPLIIAGIFFASNGGTHIAFIDALFLCVSAITVTGLTTIDLSSTTPWQQVILFTLMCLGSPVTISWVMVLVRRYFFAQKFKSVLDSDLSSVRPPVIAVSDAQGTRVKKFTKFLPWTTKKKLKESWQLESRQVRSWDGQSPATKKGKLRPEMIHRVEAAPRRVNPLGFIGNFCNDPDLTSIYRPNSAPVLRSSVYMSESSSQEGVHMTGLGRSYSCGSPHRIHPSLGGRENSRENPLTMSPVDLENTDRFPRSMAIESVRHESDRQTYHSPPLGGELTHCTISTGAIEETSPPFVSRERGNISGPEAVTSQEHVFSNVRRISRMHPNHSMEGNFGGFPSVHVILLQMLQRFFPRLHQRLARTVTVPHTTTVQSQQGGQTTVLGERRVPYITFDAIIGRNSRFHGLTRENLEELGGIEYRALNMLLWIIGMYNIGVPIVAFVIIAPYISRPRWSVVFRPPEQHRYISPIWYSLFQVTSAYTNSGMSLVDQSMVPFQKAYPEIFTLLFIILVGNTAFPVFLRWITTKFVSKDSQAYKTLYFLLDHPRRCFIYLFPSHQTWFLLLVLLLLNFTDWFFFIVLDIGNPEMKDIPSGTRVAIGLLQATAVRSAGFATVMLSALAPAVKVLYVVMMYIGVYPIAMRFISVRSTNVYEERSLGVFDDSDEDPEAQLLGHGVYNRANVWGIHLSSHARKQLSFDMWWMASALFLLCIVERGPLEDETNAFWFNIFTIIFELTSAYGTVGLSLGIPNANYSFSGALKPLSKLIICAVMLRGRHRGLPVAIDRAVLLPAELWNQEEKETRATAISSRRPSSPSFRDPYHNFEPESHAGERNKQEDSHTG